MGDNLDTSTDLKLNSDFNDGSTPTPNVGNNPQISLTPNAGNTNAGNSPQTPNQIPTPNLSATNVSILLGLTPTPELSKEVLSAQNNKVKQITDWVLPQLTPEASDQLFSKWLESLDGLLSLVGLKHISLITKGTRINDEAAYLKDVYDKAKSVQEFQEIYETLIKGQEFADVDENTSQYALNIVIVATFDAFPKLEEHLYRKLKVSLGDKFNYLIPKTFHKGSVLMIYTSLSNEFRRPHKAAAFSEYQRYTQEGRFTLKENDDPRVLGAEISEAGDLINQMFNEIYVTDFVKTGLMRKAVKHLPAYQERIKRHDEDSGNSDFITLLDILAMEYLNHQKKTTSNQLASNFSSLVQPSANHATEQKYTSDNNSSDSVYVPHGYLNQDTAMWVEVPKGNCLQYAIRGKCTRDNCEYKHVPGKIVDTPPDRKRRLNRNNSGNRFSSNHPQRSRGKDFTSNRNKKLDRKMKKITANLSKLLLNSNSDESSNESSIEPSSNDSNTDGPSQYADSDSEVKTDKEAKAFLSALKAKLGKKTKSFRKLQKAFGKKKKPNKKSKHPNKSSFDDKMKELKKKDQATKRANQAALIEAMLQERGFDLQSDSDSSDE